MKQEAIDKIKQLKAFARSTSQFFDLYKKATSDSNCDKFGAAFNGDDRFTVFKITTPIRFCAYKGYYGNSSCSTFGHINNELATKYLIPAMQKLRAEIFHEMAALAEADAKKLHSDAQKEIEGLQQMLSSIADDGVAA